MYVRQPFPITYPPPPLLFGDPSFSLLTSLMISCISLDTFPLFLSCHLYWSNHTVICFLVFIPCSYSFFGRGVRVSLLPSSASFLASRVVTRITRFTMRRQDSLRIYINH